MQEHLRNGYFERASGINGLAFCCGDTFGIAFEKVYDDILLPVMTRFESSLFCAYAGDGSHPALLGTYLRPAPFMGP